MAVDTIALMDALKIDKAISVVTIGLSHGRHRRSALARPCKALVSVSGYLIDRNV